MNRSELSMLSLLRLICAVCILIVHFPHFFFYEMEKPEISELVFSEYLSLIYNYGGSAVQVFWLLSGLIFTEFYLNKIQENKISFMEFAWRRFTRLYPLHFVTLIMMLILSSLTFEHFGKSFVYGNNDLTHFILNLFMINFWNAKFGLSFNGPFWSVSVEIFVYILFYFLVRHGHLKELKQKVIWNSLFFFCYCLGIFSPFYECLLFFFSGITLATMFQINVSRSLIMMTSIIGFFIMYYFQSSILFNPLYAKFEVGRIIDTLARLSFGAFLISTFTLFNQVNQQLIRVFNILGNLTYSTYMIHISIQIILIFLFQNESKVFYNTENFFFIYLGSVLSLGYLCYEYVELPIQNKLRNLKIQ